MLFYQSADMTDLRDVSEWYPRLMGASEESRKHRSKHLQVIHELGNYPSQNVGKPINIPDALGLGRNTSFSCFSHFLKATISVDATHCETL